MKKFNKIISLVLTFAMLMTVVPFAVSAEHTEDYNLDLYYAQIDGAESLSKAKLNAKPTVDGTYTSVRDNGIVNAKEIGIDDQGIYGDVAKYATNAPNPEGKEGTDDNYMLIPYTRGKVSIAEGYYPALVDALEHTRASMDMYLPADTFTDFVMRFYDTDTNTEVTQGETLFQLSREVSEDGTEVSAVMYLLNNGKSDEGTVIPLDSWVNLTFYFNFERDTYDVYVNGEAVAEGYKLKALAGNCLCNSFGPRCGEVDYAYAMYFDNIRYSINTRNAIPKSDTLVWENDFETAPVTEATTVTTSEGVYVKDIDYRAENCVYEIVEEAGNKYYKFYPVAGKVANSGNEFKSGYFKSSTESSADEPVIDPIDVFPIDKLRLEISMKLESLMNTQICSRYYGYLEGVLNNVYHLVKFTDTGDIKNPAGKTIGSYEAGKWMDIELYVDFENSSMLIYKDDVFLANVTLDSKIAYFNQIRIRTSANDHKEVADMSQLAVSLDNIRYYTTYGPEYVQRNSYVSEIGKLDFEELAIDSVIDDKSDMSKYYVMGVGDGVADEPAEPETPVQPEPPAVVTKPADYGRVLFAEDHETGVINKSTCETQDVSEVRLDDDNGYYVNIVSDGSKETNSIYRVRYGTATSPIQASGVAISELNKMQVSLDVYPTVAFEYPIRFYDKWSTGATIGENLLTLKAGGTIAFANSKVTVDYKLGEWLKIDTYLDFDKDVYSAFINGKAAVVDAPLKTLVNCCEAVGIPVGKKTAEFAIGVDNFRIAIPEATVALMADDTVVYESPYAATIVDDGTGNKVARVNAFDSQQNPQATRFGMSADLTRQYSQYKAKGKYPELVKVEARIMKEQGAAYIYLGNQEMVLWSGSHYFQFQTVNAETGKNVRAEATPANYKFKQWVTLTMVMDFGKGTYEAFLDGVSMGEYTIPAGVKTPEKFIIACNSAGDEHVYVDDITVSTLRAYEESAIIEYYDTAANKKYGYVIENTADTDKSYVVVEAVYNADGTLASLDMTDKSASANSYSFYELDVKEAADGGYIKYFVWNSMDSLKAMFNSIIVE